MCYYRPVRIADYGKQLSTVWFSREKIDTKTSGKSREELQRDRYLKVFDIDDFTHYKELWDSNHNAKSKKHLIYWYVKM